MMLAMPGTIGLRNACLRAMAALFSIQRQLATIRGEILKVSVFSSGRPESRDEANKAAETLERIEEQLDLTLRDLKSSINLAKVLDEAARKVPLENRYPLQQSARQKAKEAEAAIAEAERLKSLVLELAKKNGVITPLQAAKSTVDLIKDLQQYLPVLQKTSTSQTLGHPVIQPLPPITFGSHFESLAAVVTVSYLLIKYLKEKK